MASALASCNSAQRGIRHRSGSRSWWGSVAAARPEAVAPAAKGWHLVKISVPDTATLCRIKAQLLPTVDVTRSVHPAETSAASSGSESGNSNSTAGEAEAAHDAGA